MMAIHCEVFVDPSLDPTSSRNLVLRLQQQLNATGCIRAIPASSNDPPNVADLEYKSDAMLLYTLILAFVNTGAAKSLIDAVRAVVSGSHDKGSAITIRINGKPIHLGGSRLNDDEARALIADIEKQVGSS